MGYGSFSLVRKCAAQNESEKKKKAFIFLNYMMMKLQKMKKKKNLEKLVQLELHSGKMDETF